LNPAKSVHWGMRARNAIVFLGLSRVFDNRTRVGSILRWMVESSLKARKYFLFCLFLSVLSSLFLW